MCFLFSLFPATMLTVLGYFVLYCSTKADGTYFLADRNGSTLDRERSGVNAPLLTTLGVQSRGTHL